MSVLLLGSGLAHSQPPALAAGFRASRILNSYPNRQFPNPGYWVHAGRQMSGKFNGAQPGAIWIVSLYTGAGATQLNFPSPGGSYPYISFLPPSYGDQNEAYLARFDSTGFAVWLQVEPGAASIDTLIDLVLGRYKHHPCVAGFGIDVEWLNAESHSGGRKLTDSNEVKRWEERVRMHDTSYTLFLKHYAQSWMPAKYRGKILFVDDSQEFPSLSSMVNEFKAWGKAFAPNRVAFQFGYPIDTTWWKQFPDPPKAVGDALLAAGISNLSGLFWVDFTITRVFPLMSVKGSGGGEGTPAVLRLSQNFPNPFNGSTRIVFDLPEERFVSLRIFDVLGREAAVLVNGPLPQGRHSVRWDAAGHSSGIYVVRIASGGYLESRVMTLLR